MAAQKIPRGRFAPEMMLACKALAHPIRLAVVALLDERPRRFVDLLEATGSKPGTLSPHLRNLQKGGILAKELRETSGEVREEYTLSRFGERVLLAWDQAFGIPTSHTINIVVGSAAGSETLDAETRSERSSMSRPVRIPLEF